MTDESTGINIKADLDPVLAATPTGVRYIFNLLFGKKHIDAERMLKLANAQDSIDIKKIMSGEATYDHSTNKLVTSIQTNPRLVIAERIQHEETENLIECSIHAATYINENSEDATHLDSQDFINRWKNEAKLISTETAQKIWGRILAEEINAPGSISLRTLDIIKNLSKHEAESFNKACKYVIFEKVIIDNTENTPLSANEFTSIRDAGLIVSYTQGNYRSSKWSDLNLKLASGKTLDAAYIIIGKFFVFAEKADIDTSKLSFTYWELTSAGRELYKVIFETLEVETKDIIELFSELDEHTLQNLKYTFVKNNVIEENSIRNLINSAE